MSDAADFSGLKKPDVLGDYANAFAAGRRVIQAARGPNAFAAPAASGPASVTTVAAGGDNARIAVPPAPAPASAPAHRPIGEQISGLNPAQRLAAARQAEQLAAVGVGLKSVPYGERRAVLGHLGPALARGGVDPAAMAGFDPTDDNLDDQVAAALGLKAMLVAGAAAPAATPAPGPGPAG